MAWSVPWQHVQCHDRDRLVGNRGIRRASQARSMPLAKAIGLLWRSTARIATDVALQYLQLCVAHRTDRRYRGSPRRSRARRAVRYALLPPPRVRSRGWGSPLSRLPMGVVANHRTGVADGSPSVEYSLVSASLRPPAPGKLAPGRGRAALPPPPCSDGAGCSLCSREDRGDEAGYARGTTH